jgi:hypothetical protein
MGRRLFEPRQIAFFTAQMPVLFPVPLLALLGARLDS